METNDLKSIWKKHTSTKIEKDKLNEKELDKMRTSTSQSIIRKIKIGIVFELAFSAFMVLIISYFLRMDMHIIIKVSIIFLDLMFLFLLGVYFYYLRTIHQYEIVVANLKENLKQIIDKLERILKFLFIVTMVMIPLGALFGYIVGFFISAADDAVDVFNSTKNLIVFPIIILASTVIGYPLTKWYLKFMYGRHIKKLKETLSELTSEEQ